ncbi:hypothetical protein [Roseitranquillus sediminis]|uniref:hypothetical protein n=1 Tax=Roseitranquillus sediminis TaxID=2809051 RepID=UPI001D0C9DE8|nr:hypothetical protein [Roseitranquillus sediminis]MBM9593332.1 hypothetical protein [Roseitranquillus sediminis]
MRKIVLTAALLALAACGGPAEPVWAPDAEVQRRAYFHDGPPSLTLYTVVSSKNDSGAHTGLLVNGSQRVLFDPAGSFRLPFSPERNDVHFGITDQVEKVYVDYHARETFDVIRQEIVVSPEVAEMALREVQSYGAVPKAQCSLAISRVLSRLPGFEGFPRSYFPKTAMKAFAERGAGPGARISDDDADENHGILIQASQGAAQPPG